AAQAQDLAPKGLAHRSERDWNAALVAQTVRFPQLRFRSRSEIAVPRWGALSRIVRNRPLPPPLEHPKEIRDVSFSQWRQGPRADGRAPAFRSSWAGNDPQRALRGAVAAGARSLRCDHLLPYPRR